MSCIKFFDSTLRDGSHAVFHQIKRETIAKYCKAMDDAGMYTIIVGPGNGLGASSLQVGLSLLSQDEMLQTARANLRHTRLGVYMIPGFGTIRDNIDPAIANGVELFKIGCHCTEADTTRQHIEYLRNKGLEVYGVLMNCHMASVERLVGESEKMQSYGAQGVILMDSAGAAVPKMLKTIISALVDKLDIEVGFHAHDNLGMAIANEYIAVQEGASIVDGTIRGFGAGAGNAQLEALSALLSKEEYELGHDLNKMLDVSERIIRPIMPEDRAITAINIVSGLSGVVSAFKQHVINAANVFNVDPLDIFIELGKRKVVAGQEDMVIEVAERLSQKIKCI